MSECNWREHEPDWCIAHMRTTADCIETYRSALERIANLACVYCPEGRQRQDKLCAQIAREALESMKADE